MSLAVLNNALLVHAGGLALNCECCDSEDNYNCPPEACIEDGGCRVLGTNCICVDGTCVPGADDCPEFHELRDGRCIAPCNTFDCGTDSECDDGCICVNGKCEKEDSVYYCCEDTETGDRECTRGECTTGTFVYGGPYTIMTDCCVTGCHCDYRCNPVSQACEPHPDGQYTSEQDCYTECDDGGGLGSCCETFAPNSNANNTDCAIRQQANGGDCEMYRSGCRSETAQGITRSWQPLNIRSCNLCPATETGACCKPDGCCEVLCEGECEDLGGNFYGASWETCDKMRDHDGPTVGSPCDRDATCQGCSFLLPIDNDSDFSNDIFARDSHYHHFFHDFHDGNLGGLNPDFLNCVQGRKLIYYSITIWENYSLKFGRFFPTISTRYHHRCWILRCDNGNVEDVTDDALLLQDVSTVPGGQGQLIIIGDTKESQYTHSRSNGEHAAQGIAAHNEFDPTASNDPFTNNNTNTPSAFPGWPTIEDEDLWDCP